MRAVRDRTRPPPEERYQQALKDEECGLVCPCAHGTPTIKRWSFDVRNSELNQATLEGDKSELGGTISSLKKSLRVHFLSLPPFRFLKEQG
jgi:hypothetical protein